MSSQTEDKLLTIAKDRATRNNGILHSAPKEWEHSWTGLERDGWVRDTIKGAYTGFGGREATDTEVSDWMQAGRDNSDGTLDGALSFIEANIKKSLKNDITELDEKEPIKDSSHIAEAKGRVKGWQDKSWSGERAEEIFSPSNEQALNPPPAPAENTENQSYDARNKYTGPNTPESNAVLNAYKEDFAKNFSPAESNLTNAFNQTDLNQQKETVPGQSSQAQSQQEDKFLRNAKAQNLLNV